MQILYFLVCFLHASIVPLPEAVTVMTGSATFGSLQGFLIAWVGTVSGIAFTYMISKKYGNKLINKVIRKKDIDKYINYVKRNEIFFTAMLFIMPILPDSVICVGAGIIGISFTTFIIIAIISKFITTFTYAYSISILSEFNIDSTWVIIGAIGIIVLKVIIDKIRYKSVKN